MKEHIISEFECEICHTKYSKKETAIECEEKHNKLKIIPIKCIAIYAGCYPEIRIDFYPNARYRKEDNRIQLHTKSDYYGSEFTQYVFDEIQVDYHNTDDDHPNYKIYTTNLDKQHEKECIDKLVEYKIHILQDKIRNINALKNNKNKITYSKWE